MPLLKREKKLLHVASRGLEKMGEELGEELRGEKQVVPFIYSLYKESINCGSKGIS